MNNRYQFSYLTKQLLTIVVYIVFFIFIINNMIHATNTGQRVFNLLILIFAGVPALLYEFLRYQFDSATKKTIFEGKPEEALKQIETIEKVDVLKTFKTSCEMLKMLCMTDTRQFDALKTYASDILKREQNDYDVALLASYSDMIVNGELGAKGKMNEAYKKTISLRDITDKKGKRHKGAFYFNWDVVNGQHKYYDGDIQGAWRQLQKVSEDNMNKREAMHYFLLRAICAKQLNKKEEYQTYFDRALKAAGENQTYIQYIQTQ